MTKARPFLAVGIFTIACTSVWAQASQNPPGGTQSEGSLEEIVVTANKQKENISKVPISILAYSAQALQASGVKTITDLATIAPGVEFDQSAGFGPGTITNIAIRGVNSNVGTSTTGIYIDEVPVQSRVTALSYWGNPFPVLFDLERVEVARGPQGTLFGAGAEGGALRFISPEPSLTESTGFVHTEIGQTQRGGTSYEAGAAGGGPIAADKVGFRASLWARRDGGYVDRVHPFTGANVQSNSNYTDSFAGRIAFGIAATSNLKITPSVFAQKVRNHDTIAFYEALPNPPAGPAATGTANPDAGIFQNGRFLQQPNSERLILPAVKVEADLGGGMSLTSVTSYFDRRGELTDDTTGVNGALFGGYGYPTPANLDPRSYFSLPTDISQAGPEYLSTNMKSFSQELRIANAPGADFKWTAGLFYSHARQTDTQNVYAPWTVTNVINPFILPPGAPPLDPNESILFSQILSVDKQLAAFGQLDYKLRPDLTLTVGARIAHHNSDYTQSQSGFLSSTGNSTIGVTSGGQAQTPWSGKLGLTYQVDPNNMLYVSAGRGYRVGGANQPINSAPVSQGGCGVAAPETYGSDFVYSYEAGYKGKSPSGRIRIEADGFFVNWKNVQQSLFFPCQFGYIANTGTAHTRGFDFSAAAEVVDNVVLNAAVSYVKATFTQDVLFPGGVVGTPGSLVVAAGDQIGGTAAVNSPWSITAAAEYRFTVGNARSSIRLEDAYHSRNDGQLTWHNPLAVAYAPDIPVNPSTNLLNARLRMQFDRLEASAFVNNLTNTHPLLYRFQEAPYIKSYTDVTFRPRTYGVSFEYRY